MTKQEAIQKAYGEHWEAVKDYVDENGWCINIVKSVKHDLLDLIDEDKVKRDIKSDIQGNLLFRPKSLQGIETNRGWIKIESEDDLPKKQDTYHVILKNGNQYMRTFADKSSFFDVTHYQPIQIPQPPIY